MTSVQFYYDPIIELDRLFEDVFAARSRSCSGTCSPAGTAKSETPRQRDVYRPRLDLHTSEESNTVTAAFELPGFKSDDVAVDVRQNRLTISGESAAPDAEEAKKYVVRERRAGKFSRTLHLPYGTKPEDVKAKMENGVLTITFPKTCPEQQAQRIAIQTDHSDPWVSV